MALSELPLDDIMKAIKVLGVRIENLTVARNKLHNMSQDREESVRAFGARLRGQAATCQYSKAYTCTRIVDYTEKTLQTLSSPGWPILRSSRVCSGSPTNLSAWKEQCCM